MSLNKKGIEWETVSKFIFALIVIALLWVLIVGLGDFLYGTGNKAACQNWVYRNSVTAIKEIAEDLENSPCVTTEETIKSFKNENELYEKLAKNMYDCWDQYGKGEIDFYSDIGWIDKELYCRICSEIKFEENIKNNLKEIDVDNFEIYLNNHNPPNHKETYSDFFTKSENSKIDFGEGKISLDNSIYTMFTAYKGGDYSKEGFFDKLILTPLALFVGSSQIPGAGKIPKALGGLVKYNKVVEIPGVTQGIAQTVKGGSVTGLAILYIGVAGATFLTDQSVLYPSLILLPSDSPNINECDAGIYYNPEKKPLEAILKN